MRNDNITRLTLAGMFAALAFVVLLIADRDPHGWLV